MTQRLLSIGKDAKTVKGEKQGVMTGIMYLAPHTLAGGPNLCRWSTKGCRDACLFTAGRAKFCPNVIPGRMRKTQLFLEDREAFMDQLDRDLGWLERKAKAENMIPAARLNGSSDILWEETGIMEAHRRIKFYDYTKAPLEKRNPPRNYKLVYSISESRNSWKRAKEYLDRGENAILVLGSRILVEQALAEGYRGYPCVNGDLSDVRFRDPKGHLVVLKAKGAALSDSTGFVRWSVRGS